MGERDDPFVRVCVHGIAGAGKTTLAACLADARGCARLELDGLYHQAGWRPIEEATLRAEVGAFVAGDAWVVDGNYRAVRDLLWARATAIVVLDPPRRVVMARVGRRTFARLLTRRELWNGNREQWRDLLSRSPERNIVRWAWRVTPSTTDLSRTRRGDRPPTRGWSPYVRAPTSRRSSAR